MAQFATNDVVRFGVKVMDQSQTMSFRNVLNYRVNSGTLNHGVTEVQAVRDAIKTVVWANMQAALSADFGLVELSLQKIRAERLTSWFWNYDPAVEVGALAAAAATDDLRTCAVLVRKSWIAGRQAIGRFFFGPLAGEYHNKCTLVPAGGGGPALSTIEVALGTTITATSGGATITLKPCICDKFGKSGSDSYNDQGEPYDWSTANGTAVTSDNDVRIQTWSSYVYHLRTRRPGRGE